MLYIFDLDKSELINNSNPLISIPKVKLRDSGTIHEFWCQLNNNYQFE